jgi:hypothetical protein
MQQCWHGQVLLLVLPVIASSAASRCIAFLKLIMQHDGSAS